MKQILGLVRSAGRLHTSQCGGAYTLSYVMVFPVLMLLVALVVETTLMMSAKLGTVYAAHVAARTASVWGSATDWPSAEARVEFAAVQAMVPFASGSHSPAVGESASGDDYLKAYGAWAEKPVSGGYIKAKLADAAQGLTVDVGGQPRSWDAPITAQVTYDFPFHVPGLGKLIGRRGANGDYVFRLRSSAVLPADAPQNDTQDLGIGYGRLE